MSTSVAEKNGYRKVGRRDDITKYSNGRGKTLYINDSGRWSHSSGHRGAGPLTLMRHMQSHESKEADGNEPNYVKLRYTQIKPEGYVDPRDVVKTGQKGGGHTGASESSRRPVTMEGKRGWTERQRSMHSTMGKELARSN